KLDVKYYAPTWQIIKKSYDKFHTLQIENELFLFLNEIAELKPKVVIEIGTHTGGTLFAIAHFVPDNGILISIDLPAVKRHSLVQEIRKINSSLNTYIIKGDSHSSDTLNQVEKILQGQQADLLYIDGDHSYQGVKEDFLMYSPRVKTG